MEHLDWILCYSWWGVVHSFSLIDTVAIGDGRGHRNQFSAAGIPSCFQEFGASDSTEFTPRPSATSERHSLRALRRELIRRSPLLPRRRQDRRHTSMDKQQRNQRAPPPPSSLRRTPLRRSPLLQHAQHRLARRLSTAMRRQAAKSIKNARPATRWKPARTRLAPALRASSARSRVRCPTTIILLR